MQLYNDQQDLVTGINNAWLTASNVLAVAPTGSGKTVVFSNIVSNHQGNSCVIAHRQELVSQISLSLAKFGVKHKIIAPKPLIHEIVQQHVEDVGASFYNPTSGVGVAGVDTLIRRVDVLRDWTQSVSLWVQDECHHIVRGNKWGKACDLFPNAKGLGVTATPLRTDGQGLGVHADGVFNTMVLGPGMRDLIDRGRLTDYRIFAPPSDVDLNGVKITATGEFSPVQVDDRINHSHLFGDVVKHYLKIAPGKLGVTFAHNVEAATDIAARYNQAGVPAAVVHAKTPLKERNRILKQFKRRQILQLVNVDLFGEGFDLPAIEVCSMARPTQSYGLYVQQFGRALRLMDGKDWAIIIDHVGNIKRHGLPDAVREWSLDRREKATKNKHDPDKIPLKACKCCTGLYEAFYKVCPYCGTIDIPAKNSTIKEVDGDLMELDPAILSQMRGEIARVDSPASKLPINYTGAADKVKYTVRHNHTLRQEAQRTLRAVIAWYGGYHQSLNISGNESYKRFYFNFNIDLMTAQTLKTKDAEQLEKRIFDYLLTKGVLAL